MTYIQLAWSDLRYINVSTLRHYRLTSDISVWPVLALSTADRSALVSLPWQSSLSSSGADLWRPSNQRVCHVRGGGSALRLRMEMRYQWSSNTNRASILVTDNVGTDLDITNGTRVGIVLGHPDEDASELCLSSWRRKDSNAGSTTTRIDTVIRLHRLPLSRTTDKVCSCGLGNSGNWPDKPLQHLRRISD